MTRAAAVLGLLAAGFVAAAAHVSHADAASSSPPLGVYVGAADPDDVDAFQQGLGAPLQYEEDFLPTDTWTSLSSPSWLLKAWQGSGRTLVLSVPMIPASGGTLAAGAAGSYNSYFKSLAQELVAYGQPNAVIRLGWEFNGGWYRWAVKSDADAANFAAYWRQVVMAMRAVAPGLRFDWNPSAGVYPTFTLENAYPGDAYVDFIGLDVYDQSWISNYTDAQARWSDYVNQKYGLEWQAEFAQAHGKQISFPEWGVTIRSDGHGGGDDAYYIDQMHAWMLQHDVGYESYFDYDASDGEHALDDGNFPKSQAEFIAVFGNQPSSGSTTTTTRTTTTTPTTTTTTPTTTTAPTTTTHRRPRPRARR